MTNLEPAQDMRLLLIIFALNEESDLEKTVRGLQALCSPELVAGMVLLLAKSATEGCLRTAKALETAGFAIPVEVARQPSRDVLGCVKTVLGSRRHATHIMFLFADYFMESAAIADIIARAAQDRGTIYKFSRALPGGAFTPEYRPGEEWLYRLFSLFVRLLFRCGITDPVFQIMVAPVHLFWPTRFRQTSMVFGIEWVFTLLRNKISITEIPVVQLPRTGPGYKPTGNHRLHYLPITFRARFAPKKCIWEEGDVA